MWPFKRTNAGPGSLRVDLDNQWANLKGESGGLPVYVRVNTALRTIKGHPAYDHEIRVSIAFNSTDEETGLPVEEDDLQQVDELEDVFRDCLQAGQESLLALVMTTNGTRDLYFYSSNAQGAIGKFENNLRPRMTTHQVEFSARPDSNWEMFERFS